MKLNQQKTQSTEKHFQLTNFSSFWGRGDRQRKHLDLVWAHTFNLYQFPQTWTEPTTAMSTIDNDKKNEKHSQMSSFLSSGLKNVEGF